MRCHIMHETADLDADELQAVADACWRHHDTIANDARREYVDKIRRLEMERDDLRRQLAATDNSPSRELCDAMDELSKEVDEAKSR